LCDNAGTCLRSDIQQRTSIARVAGGGTKEILVEHCTSEEPSGAVFERPAPQKIVYVEPAQASAFPMHCLHCGDAPGISACPNAAMGRDSGAVVVNEDRCQGCFMFAMVCPLGAISAHSTKRVAVNVR